MEGVKGDGVKNLECEGWDVWEMKIVNKNCIAKECLNIILMSQIGHLALFKFSCLAEWLTELTRGFTKGWVVITLSIEWDMVHKWHQPSGRHDWCTLMGIR